jgi:hypothetical protein
VGKTELYRQELAPLLRESMRSANAEPLGDYLLAGSNLPGPRGNLELAAAFAQIVGQQASQAGEPLWALCLQLAAFDAAVADVNDPREFLCFCGTRGLAAIGAALPDRFAQALDRLHALARDPRWRVREGVAMGLQDLIEACGQPTLRELESWVRDEDWLAMRAVVAGVAEPRLLHDATTASTALELHRRVLVRLRTSAERRSEQFRSLRQALGYSISVLVQAAPDPGFAFLGELARSPDADVAWIVRENLKKNRLTKRFPAQVAELENAIGAV